MNILRTIASRVYPKNERYISQSFPM